MTIDDVKRVAREYYQLLESQGYKSCYEDGCDCPRDETSAMNYLMYMCDAIQGLSDEARAMRWLGFIQGVFWSFGMFRIPQLRGHNGGGAIEL